ncbi:DNA-binding protein [Halalkalibacter urbisdiaboli]|uniref:DNA-binding protein n=1 Tax=Halalkalibacter urbisdiaboli TaxID=1960589 RepID=UPI000B44F90F|nr:DNA-binding protein [Halalkalibacter urbisdiaboli]
MDFILLAIGIAAAGYFIGDGLKNFNNPSPNNVMSYLAEDDDHELIKQNEVHYFMGVSKEDAAKLIEEHPSIPHIIINGTVYYPKVKLREWLLKIEN